MFAATMVISGSFKSSRCRQSPPNPERRPNSDSKKTKSAEPPRGFIAEWTVTIILLLFGTTTLVQAFVIPTGSMEDTLLVGDHLLVDKLAFAPGGAVTAICCPMRTFTAATSSFSVIRSISSRPS